MAGSGRRGWRWIVVVLIVLACAGLVVALPGCFERARLMSNEDAGPAPEIGEPRPRMVPTLKIAPAQGWAAGEAPTPAAGLSVNAFATDLDHPRWLYRLPNGDVLVAESNGPAGKSGTSGIKGAVMSAVKQRAGSATPSADRISLLRDADGDGVAELKRVFASGLTSPFGMALVGDALYVANADAIVRFRYTVGDTAAVGTPEKIVDLPGKGDELNHHWTKSLVASADGSRLYVGVGSNSNVAENGMAAEVDRAAVLEIDPATGNTRVFASGLRNPVGLAWEPSTGALWAVVNERDELGSDLVPDYLTRVEEGAFYGWPYSYYGQHVDTRVEPARPDLVASARVPDYALGAHVAALGLTFGEGSALGSGYAQGAFMGLHGSWNRRPLSGYKVVYVPFAGGSPNGAIQDVLTGFLDEDGNARGRPVGVILDATGALLVADDVGNVVWRAARAR